MFLDLEYNFSVLLQDLLFFANVIICDKNTFQMDAFVVCEFTFLSNHTKYCSSDIRPDVSDVQFIKYKK